MENQTGMKRKQLICEFESTIGDIVLKSEITLDSANITKIKVEAYTNGILLAQYLHELNRGSNIIFISDKQSVSDHKAYTSMLLDEAERTSVLTLSEVITAN